MRVRAVLIGLFLVALLPRAVFAQGYNTPAPACTPAQLSVVTERVVMSGILDEILLASDPLRSVPRTELTPLLLELDALQRRWWRDVAPALPDCALANETRDLVGRYIEEMFLGTTLIHLASSVRMQGEMALGEELRIAADEHIARFFTITADMSALVEELYTVAG